MQNTCPNFNDPKYQAIEKALGSPVVAMQYYHNYDGDVDLLYQDTVVSKMTPASEEQSEDYKEIQGSVGADKQRLIDILGQRMYTADLSSVVMKEVLQNSFDAVKIGLNKGEIDKGKINITVNHNDRTITFEDNGVGMTPDIVQKAFFTIGGSYKGEGVSNELKSGGLGMAKMAFMFGSESLKLETVHNGKMTIVDATSAEIRSENFKLITQNTNKKNGTKLTVKIPETRIDAKGEERYVSFPSEYINIGMTEGILSKPLIGNVDVNYTNIRGSYTESKKTDLGTVPKGYELITTASTDWGSMDIYIDTTSSDFMDEKASHKHFILSSGLYQFTNRFNKAPYESIPFNIIVNIKPKVSATNEQYPFNNSREGFNKTVEEDLNALNHYLTRFYHIVQRDFYKKSFMTMTNIEKVNLDKIDEDAIKRNKELIESTSLKDPEELRKKVQDRINEFKKAESISISEGGYTTSTGETITATEIEQEKKQADEKRYASSFKAAKEINVEQIKEETGLDPSKPFIHNNTDLILDKNAAVFISEIASLMHEYRDSYVKTYGENHSPLNPNNQLWGVSIDKNYLGVNVNPKLMGFGIVAINPFSILPHANLKIENVTFISHALEHLIAHELNHNWARTEGAEFTSRFLYTDAELKSLPNHFELFQKLRKIVSNNIETLVKLKYAYEKAKNSQKSFEQNRLTPYEPGGPEEGMGTVPEGAREQQFEPGTEGSGKGTDIPLGEIILGIGADKILDDRIAQFKKLVKLSRKEVSGLQVAMINKRATNANARLGTSYFIQWEKVGQADLYRYKILDRSRAKQTKADQAEPASDEGKQLALFYRDAKVNDPQFDNPDTLIGAAIRLEPVETVNIESITADNTPSIAVLTQIAYQLNQNLGVPFNFITAEQAAMITAGAANRWNGEPAFFYNGQVYFVDNKINPLIIFHEFSHPFVKQIKAANPKLFNKLYSDLLLTPEGDKIYNEVKDNYKDLEEGSDPFKEEILVRALSEKVRWQKFNLNTSTGFKKIINDILYAIRQLIRKLFKVDASKLDVNTSLQDLALMLEKGKVIKIDKALVTEADIVDYYASNEEFIKEVVNVKVNDQQALLMDIYNKVSSHIKLLRENKNYKALVDAIKDEFNETELELIQGQLYNYTKLIDQKADEFMNTARQITNRATNLVNTIHQLNVLFSKFNDHMDDLAVDMDDPVNISRAFYYKHFANTYINFVEQFIDILNENKVPKNAKIRALLNELNENIRDIIAKSETFVEHATGPVLYEEFSAMAQAIDEKYDTIITELRNSGANKKTIDYWHKEYIGLTQDDYAEYKALKARQSMMRLNESDLVRLARFENELMKGKQITPDKINNALKGMGPDANWANSFLEGYLYSTDPIVGGVALYIKNAHNDILLSAQAKFNDFVTEVHPLFVAAGYDPNNVQQLGEKICKVQSYMRLDEEGKPVEKQVWTFMSMHKDYRIKLDQLKIEISQKEREYATTGSEEAFNELKKAELDLEELKSKYFHRKYHPAYYKALSNLVRGPEDEIGLKAKARYDEIIKKISNIDGYVYNEIEFIDKKAERDMVWREYRNLMSLYENGIKKEGEELLITERLREYREATRKFHDFIPKPGAFNKAYRKYQQELIDKGITKDNPLFEIYSEDWINANSVVKLTDSFYELRRRLIEDMNSILSLLERKDREKIDVSPYYKEIIDLTYTARNNDNQINGIEIGDSVRAKIKTLELKIEDAKKEFLTMSGLTRDESDELSDLLNDLSRSKLFGTRMPQGDYDRMQQLFSIMEDVGLSKAHRTQLINIYQQLGALSSREATPEYCDELNNLIANDERLSDYLKDNNLPLRATPSNVELIIDDYGIHPENMSKISVDFRDWFGKNHYLGEVYNKVSKERESVYKRIYIWNVIKPNNPDYYQKTTIKEEDGSERVINRVPSYRFNKRIVKETAEIVNDRGELETIVLRTPLIIGVTKDNQGNWLPRTDIPDSPFVDQDYIAMQNDPSKRDLYVLLERLKAEHLKNQEGLNWRSKLYLDIPRYRKDNLDLFRSRKIIEGNVKAAIGQPPSVLDNLYTKYRILKERIRLFWTVGKDAAELDGTGAKFNYKDQFQLIRMDLFDTDINPSIPASGLADLEIDDVSLDLGKGLMRYMLGAEKQKKLYEINPIVRSVQEIVQKNNPKDIKNIDRFNLLVRNIITFVGGKDKNKISVREKAINNLIERELEGQYNTGAGSDSEKIQQWSNILFKRASFGFFAFNIPAALKNMFGPKYQAMIESAGGKYIDAESMVMGEKWSFNTMGQLSFNIYQPKAYSVNLQLMEVMDFISDRLQNKFGERMSRTLLRDTMGKGSILDLGWFYNFRKWTEGQATLALGGAMMYKQMVTAKDGSKVRFIDAWEVVDNKIRLKDNIEPEWGITYDVNGNMKVGNKFKFVKNRIQQAITLMQGSYAEFEQPEAQRYLAFRFISYLRRYFTTMFINRWGFSGSWKDPVARLNPGLGDVHMGYYISTLRTVRRLISDFKGYSPYMTTEEKRDALKVITEVVGLLLIGVVLGPLFGWDPDDEDKYEKLRQKSGPLPLTGVVEDPAYPFEMSGFLSNHALSLLMQIRAENEQFIPWPNYGLDDYIGLFDLKSISIDPTLKVLSDITEAVWNSVTGNDAAYYKKEVGPYEWQQEGSFKVMNYAAKSFGVTGSAVDPVKYIKDMQGVKARQ